MTSEHQQTVFVLGAGFTRAFLPNAPLLRDDYGVESILAKFHQLPHIRRLLEQERSRDKNGHIDIERLMTRLDGRMPYDFDQGVNEEFSLLLSEIKRCFRERIESAKKVQPHSEELKSLAAFCIREKINCITFNYDDVFDEKLWELKLVYRVDEGTTYWHPDGGYGFFCKPSITCIRDEPLRMDRTAMFLLKLHGSVNWRLKRGYSPPYPIDAVVHHEPWLPFHGDPQLKPDEIETHLESDAFIVPPVLVKSSLVEQPILRLIWSIAFRKLEAATDVIFVGYSFPVTDLASNFLFSEALNEKQQIRVVNLADDSSERETTKKAYLRVFPWLSENDFDFRGALDWARNIVATGTFDI